VTRSDGATLSMYERGGRRRGDLALVTTTPDDPTRTATLDRWIAAAGAANASRSSVPSGTFPVVDPNGMVTLRPRTGAAVLTSCEGVPVVPYGSSAIPLAQLAGRNASIADALRHGIDPAAAACIGRAVLTDEQYRSAVQRALDRQRGLPDGARHRAARRAAATCGATA